MRIWGGHYQAVFSMKYSWGLERNNLIYNIYKEEFWNYKTMGSCIYILNLFSLLCFFSSMTLPLSARNFLPPRSPPSMTEMPVYWLCTGIYRLCQGAGQMLKFWPVQTVKNATIKPIYLKAYFDDLLRTRNLQSTSSGCQQMAQTQAHKRILRLID